MADHHPSVLTSRARRVKRLGGHLYRLRPVEWWMLVHMSLMLAALAVLQRTVALPRLVQIFDGHTKRGRAPVSPARLAQLVNGLLRNVYGEDFCMKRSLILFYYLRRWGQPARIHFGVKKNQEALDGHAWVELNGIPFFERRHPSATFATTYVYPES